MPLNHSVGAPSLRSACVNPAERLQPSHSADVRRNLHLCDTRVRRCFPSTRPGAFTGRPVHSRLPGRRELGERGHRAYLQRLLLGQPGSFGAAHRALGTSGSQAAAGTMARWLPGHDCTSQLSAAPTWRPCWASCSRHCATRCPPPTLNRPAPGWRLSANCNSPAPSSTSPAVTTAPTAHVAEHSWMSKLRRAAAASMWWSARMMNRAATPAIGPSDMCCDCCVGGPRERPSPGER
jgi:hypothetical protein